MRTAVTGVEEQRRIAKLLLNAVGQDGFALAGASAIREHGLSDRPTQDIDLFAASTLSNEVFQAAVYRAEQILRERGYEVSRTRVAPLFARLLIQMHQDDVLEVDFGVNWRANPPVVLSVGPVLSESDAVAGKLSAAYSRREVRDFLDVDAIRATGRYTDTELLALGKEHDEGFDPVMFAEELSRITNFLPSEAEEYGVDREAFAGIQRRIYAWALQLHPAAGTSPGHETST